MPRLLVFKALARGETLCIEWPGSARVQAARVQAASSQWPLCPLHPPSPLPPFLPRPSLWPRRLPLKAQSRQPAPAACAMRLREGTATCPMRTGSTRSPPSGCTDTPAGLVSAGVSRVAALRCVMPAAARFKGIVVYLHKETKNNQPRTRGKGCTKTRLVSCQHRYTYSK